MFGKRNVRTRRICTIAFALALISTTCLPGLTCAFADEAASGATTQEETPTTPTTPTMPTIKPSSLKGKTFTTGHITYTITAAKSSYKGTVTLKKYAAGKKATVPKTVKHSYKVTTGTDATTGTPINAKKSFTFTVTAVGSKAFDNSKGHAITYVALGANVKTVGSKAFYHCKHLKKVGSKAFTGTPRLCNAYSPKHSLKDFSYTQKCRMLLGKAGFKGVVY